LDTLEKNSEQFIQNDYEIITRNEMLMRNQVEEAAQLSQQKQLNSNLQSLTNMSIQEARKTKQRIKERKLVSLE